VEISRRYGVATHIYIPIIKRGVTDFAVGADWTPVAGDVKIKKDTGAAANVTNLPAAVVMGNTALWDFDITATEMEGKKIEITVADSATKAVEDQAILIITVGGDTAEHDVEAYQCKVWMFSDDAASTDRYGVAFFKNTEPHVTGITSPTIQVFKWSDGTDLIASTALTQIGSTGTYRKDEASNRITAGAGYMAKITATIDGASRTWLQPIGRDSA
jgi:hypothetical protein